MNNRRSNFKKELEHLYSKEENRNCFDCDKTPAHWASINNGIYLCLECSGEHRGFGVGVSFIKSVTLDQWNEDQMNFLRVGGNEQLKNFLLKYQMPTDMDKKSIYSSKLMAFYRRMLKAKSTGQDFEEYLPPEDEFWEIEGSNSNNSNSNSGFNIPSYSDTNSNTPVNLFQKNNSTYSISNTNYNNNEYSSSPNNVQYPKNEIVIDDNHYLKGNRYNDYSSNSNSVSSSSSSSSEPKFTYTQSKYKDNRYGSVGSEPYEPPSNLSSSSSSSSSYWSSASSILGSVWGVSSAIKDKMGEMEVGSKILYAGGKTLEAIAYTGGKVYEKGSDMITSDTVKSIASSVGSGIVYIKDKIVNGTQPNPYKDSDSRYNSRGSDDYYR